MAKFMLILHQHPKSFQDASPEEMRRIVQQYVDWTEKIKASGRYAVSDKLMDEGGKILSTRQGRLNVMDGPYSEAKEVVAGYFTVRAKNYEEAIELARDCPHVHYGRIEIRQTDPMGCGDE